MTALKLTWYGCDLRTGAIAEELPSLHPTQALSARIGAHTSATFELDLSGAPREWEAATDEGRTLLVAVDTSTSLPLWSGIVLGREGGSGTTVRLACATPEVYLDRRYPGGYTATGADATTIMAALAGPALTSGPPITLATTASTGAAIDYTVQDSDDKSIMSCLQEISAMTGAPEWTIETVWADAAQTQVGLVLRIQPTIGVQVPDPEAVFDMPGCIDSYTVSESYEKGRGATSVLARGDRADGERASSTVHTASDLIAGGWCLWEYRWTPAQGITAIDQLERHATEALALMRTGSRAWTLNAVASRAPRLGSTWALGHNVRVAVERSPRHPSGAEIIARAYAWTLDAGGDRISPILLEDDS